MDPLPASPLKPGASDPLRRLWGPITIRVAWDLLRAGVQPRPPTLRAARDHALWRLPADAGLADAEARASAAVEDFLARCAGRYAAAEPDPDLDVLTSPIWREAILAASDPIHDAVLRLHYADGLPLEEVERRTGIETALLRGARDAVRELAREVVGEDGVSLEGWEPARLDRLLVRIATAAGDLCPGPGGLATEHGRAHAEGCPRCSRALRMFREGVLSPGDLFPPEDGACLPTSTVDLCCIGVHPDARKHARALAKALGDAARLLPEDVLLIDTARVDLQPLLVQASERGAPPAARLRIVRRTVAGRWVPRAVIGPGVETLLTALPGMAWGEVEGMEPLPEPLPPPPSAARYWVGAAFVALLAVAAGVWTFQPGVPPTDVALEAHAQPGAVLFDTDDDAWVEVIALRDGRAEVVFHSDTPGAKGALATGDGRFRLETEADALVLVASRVRLDGVERVLGVLPPSDVRPVDVLVARLRERYVGAAVVGVP
ncbi:MAG: hypothetical protein Q8P41_14705 [Pseudomonadota bacterium]|nr:hypothetical protein [Pseudomonadota bacterium]